MTLEELKVEISKPQYAGMKEAEIVAALKAKTIDAKPAPLPEAKISRLQELGWPDLSEDDVRTAKATDVAAEALR